MKKLKRKYWINLSWLKDGYKEQYLYKTKEDCQATLPEGDELRRIEIKEL